MTAVAASPVRTADTNDDGMTDIADGVAIVEFLSRLLPHGGVPHEWMAGERVRR